MKKEITVTGRFKKDTMTTRALVQQATLNRRSKPDPGFMDFTVTKNPLPDMCHCSSCNTTFKVTACDSEYGHHDGWEMPAYTEITCRQCEDGGCIDDFWFSEDER